MFDNLRHVGGRHTHSRLGSMLRVTRVWKWDVLKEARACCLDSGQTSIQYNGLSGGDVGIIGGGWCSGLTLGSLLTQAGDILALDESTT